MFTHHPTVPQVAEYLVFQGNAMEVSAQVTVYLQKGGWILFGPPFALDSHSHIVQAMIRIEVPEQSKINFVQQQWSPEVPIRGTSDDWLRTTIQDINEEKENEQTPDEDPV